MPKLDRFNIVLMADTHAGSKLALRNPDWIIQREVVEFDEEGWHYETEDYYPPMEPVQELLWEQYIQTIQDFSAIADGDPIFLLHLGEVCEGTYYANSSMRLKKDEQVQIAVANMMPWEKVKNIKMVRILSGDRPHEFDEGSASRMVVNQLKPMFGDVKGLAHGLLNIGGFKVDYKHKGAFPGSRKWLEGKIASYDLTDLMLRELVEWDRDPADLVVSAHYHVPIEVPVSMWTKDGMIRSTLLIAPCMKFPDAHAKHYAMGQKNGATIGMAMVEVVNNKILNIHHRCTMVDTRVKEIYNG